MCSVEPHQFRRIVVEHHFDLMLLDAEREQRANENTHSIDAVHMKHLAEVAADNATLRPDGFDGFNRLFMPKHVPDPP